jgi:hypothetical protein
MGDFRPPYTGATPFGATEYGSGRDLLDRPERRGIFATNMEMDYAQEFAQIRAQLSRIEAILLELSVHAGRNAGGADTIADLRALANSLFADRDDLQAQLDAMRKERE